MPWQQKLAPVETVVAVQESPVWAVPTVPEQQAERRVVGRRLGRYCCLNWRGRR
ncbi:MAG TPA: hypothetical protein VLA83_03410 [Candidatus Binatia bacterium]|nr:hypothetical protein [Candidatus Binatia bacterium]